MKNNQTIAQFLGIKTFPFEIKNDQGKTIYFENSNGYWRKREYDANGNCIYSETSDGGWTKREYNANGNQTRFEMSTGYWETIEYDANGNQIYSKDSYGYIVDNRPKQVELTLAEIAEKLNIPIELLRIKE